MVCDWLNKNMPNIDEDEERWYLKGVSFGGDRSQCAVIYHNAKIVFYKKSDATHFLLSMPHKNK